jgi:hypothetical protein
MKKGELLAYLVAALVITFCAMAMIHAAKAHEGHHITNSQYRVPESDNAFRPKPQGEMIKKDWGDYLYGINRDRNASTYGDSVNCCKYGGDGDCQLMPVENVKIVPGGYEVAGEFISEEETTASPDDSFYRCQHAGKPSHCFFAPPQGF